MKPASEGGDPLLDPQAGGSALASRGQNLGAHHRGMLDLQDARPSNLPIQERRHVDLPPSNLVPAEHPPCPEVSAGAAEAEGLVGRELPDTIRKTAGLPPREHIRTRSSIDVDPRNALCAHRQTDRAQVFEGRQVGRLVQSRTSLRRGRGLLGGRWLDSSRRRRGRRDLDRARSHDEIDSDPEATADKDEGPCHQEQSSSFGSSISVASSRLGGSRIVGRGLGGRARRGGPSGPHPHGVLERKRMLSPHRPPLVGLPAHASPSEGPGSKPGRVASRPLLRLAT